MNDDGLSDEELLDRLGAAMNTRVPDPTPERVQAIRAAALGLQRAGGAPSLTEHSDRHSTRRTLLLSSAAAAVGVVTGAVIGNVARDDPADPATADPGPSTEPLTFSPSSVAVPGSELSGKVINHTWGVELLLDTTGLPVGDRFRVLYVSTDGELVEAGGFIGAELPIHCRCNAALLRERIAAIEVHAADDSIISRAELR